MTRHLPVRGAYNIRDLGGYTTASGGTIPWRRFLRADSLHRIDPSEITRLHDEGLRMVIDLRTEGEVTTAPNPFAAFPDVHFANMPLFDDLSPAAMSNAVVEDAHPLQTFYLTALETRADAIGEILSAMAEVQQGAVLFNCTAGKDRTGIIAALLLGIADVHRDQIIADYTMTADFIPDLVAEFLDLSRARGGDVESYARLLESPAPAIAATLDHIDAHYGSVTGYLRHIGLPPSDLRRLFERLTES
ncbi:tyrosine-protein phosphatase [Sulfitobacter sp. THAF37]|uniref:tyrosine-protein phosphatase n=1 Tax=Sulfitobacter sp. THAF37 TaxID=2587855 RepID=UPI001C12B1B0|nr:tyrosine-protein phosphatase [Sulfitobacter sp. THAF37]